MSPLRTSRLESVAELYQIAEGMPGRMANQREGDHKAEKTVTKTKSIAPAISAAHSAMAFGFLRQALMLVSAAVTT